MRRRHAFRKPRRVRLRMFDVPPPHTANVAVSPRTDPPPMIASPIAEVVPAAGRAAGGPAAQLIGRVVGAGESLLRDQVLVSKIIIIRRRKVTAPDPRSQPSALLHDQCIGADVLRRSSKRGIETRPPIV